jgi:hypothetical protein
LSFTCTLETADLGGSGGGCKLSTTFGADKVIEGAVVVAMYGLSGFELRSSDEVVAWLSYPVE